jgi:hypothetical protein
MPRGDKTGPLGQGSMTGRKLGNCNNHNGLGGNGNMNGTRRGFGRNNNIARGFGRGFGFGNFMFNEKTANDLQTEIEQLKAQIKNLEEKLKN